MESLGWTLRSVFILWALALAAKASACPEVLRNRTTTHLQGLTLCEVYDRYQGVLFELQRQGVTEPKRMADLLAPRFINGPFWEANKKAKNFSPWMMYAPAPDTWLGWEAGNALIEAQIADNRRVGKFIPITLDWVRSVHREALQHLHVNAGEFRDQEELGLSLYRAHSIDRATVEQIANGGGYRPRGRNEPLYKWTPTLCYEEQSAAVKEYMDKRDRAKGIDLSKWPAIDPTRFYNDGKGSERQCGYIVYSQLKDVPTEITRWVANVNWFMRSWDNQQDYIDPLAAVARTQRWFIGIHPFTDGNGRISRYMMDLLVGHMGLPAPILSDMDRDVYISEEAWADEIGRGILRHLEIAESCARNVHAEGCNVVSRTPPPLEVKK